MPMVSTCGSGITACVVALAAHLLNHQVPVYDVRQITLLICSDCCTSYIGLLG